MKHFLIPFGIVTIVVAFVLCATNGVFSEHTTPPPGYTIVCDGQGHYGAMMPGGHVVAEFHLGGQPMTHRWRAVARAWQQYNFQHEAPSVQWKPCDGVEKP